jgi:hypothetical protein
MIIPKIEMIEERGRYIISPSLFAQAFHYYRKSPFKREGEGG